MATPKTKAPRSRGRPGPAAPKAPPAMPAPGSVPPQSQTTIHLLTMFREDPPADEESIRFYQRALLRSRAIDFGIYQG